MKATELVKLLQHKIENSGDMEVMILDGDGRLCDVSGVGSGTNNVKGIVHIAAFWDRMPDSARKRPVTGLNARRLSKA